MHAQQKEFFQLLDGEVQYVVPRWQRKYCWQENDIRRLIDDLLAIAQADDSAATHYAGTLLAFQETGVPGDLPRHRVVDGQQRLTTVSILPGCIANKMDRDGDCEGWTANRIRQRITNEHMNHDRRLKLLLQDEDSKEYQSGLFGKAEGAGAVAQAWRITNAIVERTNTADLLRGLSRLRVVSIGLDTHDDPQQIFESINATGRPLKESEKVKNWMLIGLHEDEQKVIHNEYWKHIEQALDATYSSDPIDIFLRDVMRWRTGETIGADETFASFRRWARKQRPQLSRTSHCKELARLATLYGILKGSIGGHSDRGVERQLRHLRAFGIHVHRPLTLRMLDDASRVDASLVNNDQLAKAFSHIGTWLTRSWLADKRTGGLNTAITSFAFRKGPEVGEGYADYWHDLICRLRNQSIGVPTDRAVQEGLLTRKAYGGSATQSTNAILCELMETQHGSQAPARDRLTVEHVLPQKLTPRWIRDLGENAIEIHRNYRNQFANLTLCGEEFNSSMSNNSFADKKAVYHRSTIGLTRQLATYEIWNENALLNRAEYLTLQILNRWAWEDVIPTEQDSDALFRWRVEDGEWNLADVGTELVLAVTKTLLEVDPENALRLSGDRPKIDLVPASQYPSKRSGSVKLANVPGYEDWLICPYTLHYKDSLKRCRELASRCQVTMEVELTPMCVEIERFWDYLQNHLSGFNGRERPWWGGSISLKYCDVHGSRLALNVWNPRRLKLHCSNAGKPSSDQTTDRLHRISLAISERMSDQELSDIDKRRRGTSVSLLRQWNREDESSWLESCQWIENQCVRLEAILADFDPEKSDSKVRP